MNRLPSAAARLAMLVGCAWAVGYHLTVDILPYDDAYIPYRYAEHLVAGQGLVYNAGERVFGCTSPLWTLWLAVLKAILPSVLMPVLAVRGNIVFYLLSALAMSGLVRTLSGRKEMGLLAGAIFALHPAMEALSSGGKETFLFIALMLGALSSCGRGRILRAAGLAGLSLLARPEGVFVMAAVILGSVGLGRKRPVGFWSILLLPGAAWAGFSLLYFGTVVPESITAKLLPVYPVPPGYALRDLIEWLGRWTIPAGLPDSSMIRDLLALAVAEAGAFGLLIARPRSATPREATGGVAGPAPHEARSRWIVPAMFNAFLLFYALANPLLFDWYTANLFVFWVPAILVGLPALGAAAGARLSRGSPSSSGEGSRTKGGGVWRAASRALAATILAASIVVPYAGDLSMGRSPEEASRSAVRLRTRGYKDMAQWLNAIAAPGATVLTPEAGTLGYYWQGRLIDSCGLVSPAALPYLPVPPADRADLSTGAPPIAIPLALVQAEKPDYIVTLKIFAEKTLGRGGWFSATYRQLKKFPFPKQVWGCEAVYVMQRTDLPPPPGEPTAAGGPERTPR